MRIVILDPDGIQLGAADLCGLPFQAAPSGFLSTKAVVVTISRPGQPHSFDLRDADGTHRANDGKLLNRQPSVRPGDTITFCPGDLFVGLPRVNATHENTKSLQ